MNFDETKKNKQKIENLKNYYNGIAKGYSNLYHQEQEKKINLVKKYIPNSGKILDLGCGDGVLNKFILNNKNSNLELFSVDISSELLKLNSNTPKNKFNSNIENLTFENDFFDYIFSFTVIQDTLNIEKAFLEINRVLKKNGLIILSFLKRSTKKEMIENYIINNFEIITKIEEEKDFIFIFKKK